MSNFENIIAIVKLRLEKFKAFKNKHIIYGGDLGGDLAIDLMDEVFGRNNYRIYASILPCYSGELKAHIGRKIANRANVTYFDGGTSCNPVAIDGQVSKGVCSNIHEVMPKHETETIEICGCFFTPISLDNYITFHRNNSQSINVEDNGWWYKRVVSNTDTRYYLFLFAHFGPEYCEKLIIQNATDKLSLGWWRTHVCLGEENRESQIVTIQQRWEQNLA